MLSDLLRAASTGPAFEPPLLVSDGPTALNPGETSCLACETLHPAAKTRRQKRHVNLYKNSAVTVRHSAERPDILMHSYWLLLAEEKTAKLWIGSWVREAEDGTLRRCLSTLCDLVGWSAANWRLLVGWYGCSHRHLEEPRLKIHLDFSE